MSRWRQLRLPPPETPVKTDNAELKDKSNGKALLLGSLAALAIGAGIYLSTRGKKTKLLPKENFEILKCSDGSFTKRYFNNSGKILKKETYTADNIPKMKYYFDEKTGNIKEFISYNKDGNISIHNWFDGTLAITESQAVDPHNIPSLLRSVSYHKNGNKYMEIVTHPNSGGKIFKIDTYQEDNGICSMRKKFDKNGNETFSINRFPGDKEVWFASLYENNKEIAAKMFENGKWNYV